MRDFAKQFGIPEIPDSRGELQLSGQYVRSLYELGKSPYIDIGDSFDPRRVPVVGCSLDGVIVFIDIGGYTDRTSGLTPGQTLFWVNRFFQRLWPLCEKARGTFDKVIGDCLMLVFAKVLGCPDPLDGAVGVALEAIRWDMYGYYPHIGVASGRIWLGYAGPPHALAISVYGTAVNLAARLASVAPSEAVAYSTEFEQSVQAAISSDDKFKTAAGDQALKGFEGQAYSVVRATSSWCPQFDIGSIDFQPDE